MFKKEIYARKCWNLQMPETIHFALRQYQREQYSFHHFVFDSVFLQHLAYCFFQAKLCYWLNFDAVVDGELEHLF